MLLASAYLGGAYFFARAASATQWHRIGGGFVPVAVFASLLGVATIVHWDKFLHTNVAFWLWAGLYFSTPFLVVLIAIAALSSRGDVDTGKPLTWLFGAGFLVLAVASGLLYLRMERRSGPA